jgi:hypothetical protein
MSKRTIGVNGSTHQLKRIGQSRETLAPGPPLLPGFLLRLQDFCSGSGSRAPKDDAIDDFEANGSPSEILIQVSSPRSFARQEDRSIGQ